MVLTFVIPCFFIAVPLCTTKDSGPGAKKATFLMDTPNFLIWNGLILGAGILLGVVWLNLRRLEQKGTGGNAGEGDNEKVLQHYWGCSDCIVMECLF